MSRGAVKLKGRASDLKTLLRRVAGERGATSVEYAIMIVLIAVVIFASVQFLGVALTEAFQCVVTKLGNPSATC